LGGDKQAVALKRLFEDNHVQTDQETAMFKVVAQ